MFKVKERDHFERKNSKKYLLCVYFVVYKYSTACKWQLKVLKSYHIYAHIECFLPPTFHLGHRF